MAYITVAVIQFGIAASSFAIAVLSWYFRGNLGFTSIQALTLLLDPGMLGISVNICIYS